MAGLRAWPLYTPWWGQGTHRTTKSIGGPAALRLIPMGLTFVLWARDAVVRFRAGRATPRYHVNSSQFSSCSFSHAGVSCSCDGRDWGIGTDRVGYLWNDGTEGWCKALWLLWHWGTVRGECHSGMRGPRNQAWRAWVGGYSRLQHLHPCGHWCHCRGQTLQGSCEVHWIQTRCLPWCRWNWVGAEVGTLGEGRTRVEGRRAGHGCWGPGRRGCTQDSLRKAGVKGGRGGGERGCGVSPSSKGGHGVMRTPKHRVTGSHGHYGGCISTPERCDRAGRRCDGVHTPSGRHIRPKCTPSGTPDRRGDVGRVHIWQSFCTWNRLVLGAVNHTSNSGVVDSWKQGQWGKRQFQQLKTSWWTGVTLYSLVTSTDWPRQLNGWSGVSREPWFYPCFCLTGQPGVCHYEVIMVKTVRSGVKHVRLYIMA